MKVTSFRASAKRQLLDGMGVSTSHAQAATTIIRQEKMAARKSMKTLNEAFTEGTRADDRLAKRRASSQVTAANGYTPKYVPAAKKVAQARRPASVPSSASGPSISRSAILMSKTASGETAYVPGTVLSAADKYRLARQNGEQATRVIPAIDGPEANAAAQAASASVATLGSFENARGVSIPLFLLFGLGVGK